MKKTVTLLLFLIGFFRLDAAIVYTDINPDVTSTLDPNIGAAFGIVAIDFDGDGTEEYNFRWDDWGTQGWFMHMTFAGNGLGNEFILKGTQTNPFGGRYLDTLHFGSPINSGGNWGNSLPEPFIGDDADPNFQGLGDQYVGCKFTLNGNTHYGWVLLSFDMSKTLTVKSYAYENVPNTTILAGDTGGSTGNIPVTSITVQSQNNQTSINTMNGSLQMSVSVLPANATNSSVTWSIQNNNSAATINQNGLLQAVSDGNVTVVATANDGSGVFGTKSISISNQTVGIGDDGKMSMILYPNPASTILTIQNHSGQFINSMMVYTIDGRFVERLTNSQSPYHKIDVSNYTSGIYFIEIDWLEGQKQQYKWVKK